MRLWYGGGVFLGIALRNQVDLQEVRGRRNLPRRRSEGPEYPFWDEVNAVSDENIPPVILWDVQCLDNDMGHLSLFM
jgi:hypothetical protein